MDIHFLEWWGNFLLSVAKGQRQMEDMERWLSQGFKGFPDLTAMLKRAYDLEEPSRETPDAMSQWPKVNEQFLKSYGEFLEHMGVGPRPEHLRLVKKYEALKEKAAEQEETIRHLRMLTAEKGPDPADQAAAVQGFQKILQCQTEQFQELMGNLSRFYEERDRSSSGEKGS